MTVDLAVPMTVGFTSPKGTRVLSGRSHYSRVYVTGTDPDLFRPRTAATTTTTEFYPAKDCQLGSIQIYYLRDVFCRYNCSWFCTWPQKRLRHSLQKQLSLCVGRIKKRITCYRVWSGIGDNFQSNEATQELFCTRSKTDEDTVGINLSSQQRSKTK